MKRMNDKISTFILLACAILSFSRQMNAQTTDHANSLNRYSFDLYHEVRNEKENFLLSPLSTYYTLLTAYEGSIGKTKQEFEKALYIKEPDSVSNAIFHALEGKQDGYDISNAIWLNKDTEIKEEYRKSLTRNYFSDFRQTDFKNAASAASDINRWVSEKTNQKINEIVDVSNIRPNSQLLISNVVYFKGEWFHKFDRQKTISGNFFTNSSDLYSDVFMNMTDNLEYFENDLFQFISKPYKDSQLSFCIILPKDLFGLEEVEKNINADSLREILDNAYNTRTMLYIPRLNLESSYELSSALNRMGLQAAFSNVADFSGITEEVPLKLELILHKTIIELDEEKTEAAAVTAQTTYIAGRPSYKIFKADHPFMFFVIDNRSKAILFMGRYVKPSGRKASENEYLEYKLESRKEEPFSSKGWSGEQKLLHIVDGEIYREFKYDSIDWGEVESVNIITDKEQMQKYSTENYDGVIKNTMKKKKK